jgi:hypothetical protein
MSERVEKWLLWTTLIIFIVSVGVLIFSLILSSNQNEVVGAIGLILLILSGIILPVLLTNKFKAYKWFLSTSRILIYLLPVFIFVQYLAIDVIHSDLITLFTIVVVSELMLFAIINIFIVREAGEIKFVLILLLSIILSFIILKASLFQKKLSDFDFLLFIFLTIITGGGMLLFGFRCLFQLRKNSYLKTVSFIACILIAFCSIVFIAKMQSEKTDIIELVYFIPAILMTLIVLFSLPFSGYIHWISLHKQILKKVMIIWIFFLFIISVSFVYPDLFKKIVFKPKKPIYEFLMDDYKLQNKNGLESN